MLLLATFVPSVVVGLIVIVRLGDAKNSVSEGFAAFCCSAILNGVVAYSLTH